MPFTSYGRQWNSTISSWNDGPITAKKAMSDGSPVSGEFPLPHIYHKPNNHILFNQTIHIFTRNLHQKWVTSTNFADTNQIYIPCWNFPCFCWWNPHFCCLVTTGPVLVVEILWISSSIHAAKSRLCWNMRIITRCHNSIPISTITDLYSWLNYAKTHHFHGYITFYRK